MLALMFQVGADRWGVDVRRVRQVLPRVPLNRPSGSPPWLAGILVYRGTLLPVIDLFHYFGVGECPDLLSSRIIVATTADAQCSEMIGLLATDVSEMRELSSAAIRPDTALVGQSAAQTGGFRADGGELIRLLEADPLFAAVKSMEF